MQAAPTVFHVEQGAIELLQVGGGGG
jgi:hypothetical protein